MCYWCCLLGLLLLNLTIIIVLFASNIFHILLLLSFGFTSFLAAKIRSFLNIGATSDKLSAIIRWYYWAQNQGLGLSDIITYFCKKSDLIKIMLRFKVTGYRPYRQAWNKNICVCTARVCIEQINDMGCVQSLKLTKFCAQFMLLALNICRP